jgi:hypothetical protein
MMHTQAKSEKESDEKDDDNNLSQASQRSNKTNKEREWMNLVVKKETYTAKASSGHQAPRMTVSCWITD